MARFESGIQRRINVDETVVVGFPANLGGLGAPVVEDCVTTSTIAPHTVTVMSAPNPAALSATYGLYFEVVLRQRAASVGAGMIPMNGGFSSTEPGVWCGTRFRTFNSRFPAVMGSTHSSAAWLSTGGILMTDANARSSTAQWTISPGHPWRSGTDEVYLPISCGALDEKNRSASFRVPGADDLARMGVPQNRPLEFLVNTLLFFNSAASTTKPFFWFCLSSDLVANRQGEAYRRADGTVLNDPLAPMYTVVLNNVAVELAAGVPPLAVQLPSAPSVTISGPVTVGAVSAGVSLPVDITKISGVTVTAPDGSANADTPALPVKHASVLSVDLASVDGVGIEDGAPSVRVLVENSDLIPANVKIVQEEPLTTVDAGATSAKPVFVINTSLPVSLSGVVTPVELRSVTATTPIYVRTAESESLNVRTAPSDSVAVRTSEAESVNVRVDSASGPLEVVNPNGVPLLISPFAAALPVDLVGSDIQVPLQVQLSEGSSSLNVTVIESSTLPVRLTECSAGVLADSGPIEVVGADNAPLAVCPMLNDDDD